VLTFYGSGKVVVQGRQLDAWLARHAPSLAGATGALPERLAFEGPTIGSDEVGKGDYFGPLVVAAVYAEPAHAARLAALGVADSKTLADARALRLAGQIEREPGVEHRTVVLDPVDYNAHHQRSGNVNLVLAELHARAIAPLLAAHPEASVVVDKFADDALVARALRAAGGRPRQLVQVTRGERHPVVAAASVLARAAFLDALRRLADDSGCDLHKGAGEPVDTCAQRVFDVGGMDLLGKVAKLHFQNTRRIRRTGP
jgi:ribonuclease HIII